MIRRPPRSTLDRSSAASDVYKRQSFDSAIEHGVTLVECDVQMTADGHIVVIHDPTLDLSLIHISEPTRPY
mgnify:CR=1 FL=1